ncbi:nitronate monooxygenase [Bradyrhizobium sp. AS23.2]|uniref:NAD(P)H-dependent flavin oxidoreductase n=1 Tax=Bradyrhizobium sp. AS23.2 TaxID=1680155 RepID=UPI001AD828C3|nr:nitronate monooxygenase [Bradyrhizobium sp. AS23.2]
MKTRITELLGIRHPILCGGLGPGVSDGKYVAAVVNAGCMGFIVATSPADEDWLEHQIAMCRSLVGGKGFGVNMYISKLAGGADRMRKLIPLLADNGVTCVETAGASPDAILPALREAGIVVIHKVPAVRYAHTAARVGVDAVTVVGADCGGHPGTFLIGTMVQTAHAARDISLPLVVGGGIGTGSHIAAALAMGADAVVLGTRMMVSEELWVHPSYKEHIAQLDGTQSVVVKKLLRDHHRVLNNESARDVLALENAGSADFEDYRPHVVGALAHNAYSTGDLRQGMLDFGPAAVFANKVQSVEAIVDELIDEALAASQRLDKLRVVTSQNIVAAE